MKYAWNITSILLASFMISQVAGLWFVSGAIQKVTTLPTGEVVITHEQTIVERPETTGFESVLYILAGVGIATCLLLVLIRFKLYRVWELWFFLAVFLTVTVALGVYLPFLVAGIAALALSAMKIFLKNPVIHNMTEVLMYAGIAVLFVPIFDIVWVTALLIAISVYDIIAVRKTKHMVKMAMFLTERKLFAGLSIPLPGKAAGKLSKAGKGRAVQQSAILGGGDITFPLLFSGVVFEGLIRLGLKSVQSFALTMIVTACVAASLLFLFMIAKKGKFYPAMPFLTAGCLAGYVILQAALLV